MNKEFEDIKNGLAYFTYFSKLDEEDIKEGCSLGKIKIFTYHETILGDNIGLLNFAYFVLSGQCCLIETLKIKSKDHSDLDAEEVNENYESVKTHFMQVCLINPGGCFNMEELADNRRIIAVDKVTCMLLPKHWLWQKNTSNIWGRVKHFLGKKIPTTETVREKFLMNRSWVKYKRDIVKSIVDNKKAINYTTIHDVPYSIRMNKSLL